MTQYSGEEFIGFSVTREEKQAVRELARVRGGTMSDMLREVLRRELADSGVEVGTAEAPGPPLPFEGESGVETVPPSKHRVSEFVVTAINRELKKA